MTDTGNKTGAGLVLALLLAAGQLHAADTRITQQRTAGDVSVIELEIPAAAATASPVAPSKTAAVHKARQLMDQASIRPQLMRGAVAADRSAAREDYALADERSSAATVRFQRTLDGIPVFGEEAIVDFDTRQNARQLVWNARHGRLKHAPDAVLADADLRARALQAARGLLGGIPSRSDNAQRFWVAGTGGTYTLQYRIDVSAAAQAGGRYRLWLDAASGHVLRYYTLEHEARDRAIYDLRNQESGDAILVKNEAGNVAPYAGSDTAVENLFDYFGKSYDYFWATFGRDSFDGSGATVTAIAHIGQNYNNAYWCGCPDAYFAFGDGDGSNFLSFTRSLHVVGHEFTHAVTERTAGLEYFALSGALNEAMSDIFGKMVEARHNNGSVPDWLVGKEVVGPQFGRPAMRNMKDPHQGASYDPYDPLGNRNQPEHMDEIYLGQADARGVHVNSSLANKMVQLLVDGGTHRNVSVTAMPLADVGKIVYNTLSAYLTASSDLYDFADGLRNACQVLAGSLQTPLANCQASVNAAARAIGLRPEDLNFGVRLAGARQVSGNGNARLESGEQFDLILDVFNKGVDLPSVDINATVSGSALSFTPLNYVFNGSSSFGDRRKIALRGTVNQTLAGTVPVTLQFTASGRNPQQVVLNVGAYGVFDAPDYSLGARNVPTAFDLDGDGIKELISIDGVARALTIHHPVKGLQSSTAIPASSGYNRSYSAYQVAVDDFGMGDVRIVSAEDATRLSTYNAQGVRLNSFTAPTANNYNAWGSPSPVIADLDGDGSKEIVFATTEMLYLNPDGSVDYTRSERARIYVLDKNLTVRAGWPQTSLDTTPHGYEGWDIAVGDVDGDGRRDIVVVTDHQVTVLDDQGRTKSGWPWNFTEAPALMPHPALADVNGDGKLEIFFGNSNGSKVYALQSNGTLLAGFPRSLPAGVISDRVLPADIDGDGQYELVLGGPMMGSWSRGSFSLGFNYNPAVISLSGQLLPGWPKKMQLFSPLIADVSGDGRPDIVAGDENGLLHAFSLQGVEQPGFPLNVGNGWRNAVGGAVIGEFNGDGMVDMAYTEYNAASFGGSDGLGLIQFRQPYVAASMLWPAPARNAQNSSAPAPRGFSVLNFRGTSNNWGVSPMRAEENGVWSIVVTIPGTAQDRFKFDASSNWTQAYGDTNRDGIAGVGEADIYFNRPAGAYLVRFNDQTRGYSISVAPNQPPVANAGAASVSVGVNQPLSLDGSASSDPEGGPISCAWTYATPGGDQGIGNTCVSSHTFTAEGTYTVKLTVTDNQGLTATALKTVTVTAGGTWQRTVIFIQGTTSPGQDMFIRGGIDHAYALSALGRTCTQANMQCAIPIRHRNLRNATTNPWKTNDKHLDWYGFEPAQATSAQGTPLDWTTNNSAYAATVAVQGYGYTPLNTWGDHQWMLDVDMDCSRTVNGWFELKAFISNGPGWEGNVSQPGAPYPSNNHFGQCGKLNRFISGQSAAVIQNLP